MAQRLPQLRRLLPNHVTAEIAVGPLAVTGLTHILGKIEHQRDRQKMVLAREIDERLTRTRLDIGGIDYG